MVLLLSSDHIGYPLEFQFSSVQLSMQNATAGNKEGQIGWEQEASGGDEEEEEVSQRDWLIACSKVSSGVEQSVCGVGVS